MAKWSATLVLIFSTFLLSAQQPEEINTENGWILPTHGKIRLFVIFAEVDYDLNPNKQTFEAWPKGNFPPNYNNLFAPTKAEYPNGKMTTFFHESSFGTYQVMGDYYPEVISIKQSDMRNGRLSTNGIQKYIAEYITKKGFKTSNGLPIEDFDLWTNNDKAGRKKVNQPDHSLDHVMLILRNFHGLGLSRGFASQGSFADIAGYRSDSYTVFSGADFQIMRHEYCHLLFGGNNFHCGGGQHNGGGSNYFIPLQGGWSCMGNYNSMFMTCNAWDRNRLGWKPQQNQFLISAIDANTGKEINTDFNGAPSTKTYTIKLRDFITHGDAIRVKLPFIPSNRYQQWIWLENHQTEKKNGSEFDQFQYEELDCKPAATPGIYAYLQIDKNDKKGSKAFKGYGDYLKVLPANGFYDVFWEEDPKQQTSCANAFPTEPFYKIPSYENPLSGTSDVEYSVIDLDKDGRIKRGNERIKWLEKRNGAYVSDLPHLGLPTHAFTVKGNNELNFATNPSTASKLSLASLDGDIFKGKAPNNRTVRLNGISIKLLKENADGSIEVQVSFNHNLVNDFVRWCGDTISLQNHNLNSPDLIIEEDGKIVLDRGLTPTRVDRPQEFANTKVFSSPTNFVIEENAAIHIKKGGALILKNGSTLRFKRGAYLKMEKKSKLKLDDSAQIIFEEGSNINRNSKSKLRAKPNQVIGFKDLED